MRGGYKALVREESMACLRREFQVSRRLKTLNLSTLCFVNKVKMAKIVATQSEANILAVFKAVRLKLWK